MPKVPYPYEVNGKLVTGNGSLIPICSLSNNSSLLPSLTVLGNLCIYNFVLTQGCSKRHMWPFQNMPFKVASIVGFTILKDIVYKLINPQTFQFSDLPSAMVALTELFKP